MLRWHSLNSKLGIDSQQCKGTHQESLILWKQGVPGVN